MNYLSFSYSIRYKKKGGAISEVGHDEQAEFNEYVEIRENPVSDEAENEL